MTASTLDAKLRRRRYSFRVARLTFIPAIALYCIFLACKARFYVELVALLIRLGANPRIADALGEIPLDYGKKAGNQDIISLMAK